MKIRIVVLLLLLLIAMNANAVKLLAIETRQQSNNTTLHFTLDGNVTYKTFTLNTPNRLVVDLDKASLAIKLKQINLGNGLIKQVRSGYPNNHTLRIVFEMSQAVLIKTSAWHPMNNKKGFIIELMTAGAPPKVHPIASIPINNPAFKAIKQTPIPIRHAPERSLRDVVVVLDAGHGGKDPGASGPKRSLEKNITLAIAWKLKQIIDKQPGMHAVMTRTGDYYVGLRERLKIARKYNGDVFVSIHADAFINQQSNGASVFALSQIGATSEAARWLAEKENYSELGGVNLSDLDDQNGLVRTVLIDLSQTATIGASLHMGERVLRNLDKMTNLHNRKVEQARFMVLKSPDIPSILIETGFISNPHEEYNLASTIYQSRLTQSIFQGIKQFFWDYPPHGTRIEALANNNVHLVRRDESLPQIAARYQVSVAAIQTANHLTGKGIKTGQKLIIPSSWT